MTATDSILARYSAEIEERQKFIDGLVEDADQAGRDLTAQELELVTRTRDRIQEVNAQIDPLKEAAAISRASQTRTAEIAEQFAEARNGHPARTIEYRSAGAYVLDYWKARVGVEEAANRIELYTRAAAHQTTADNPGLLPEQILGPVINFIDAVRPLVSALGPRQLPSGTWSRPRVTQHSNIAKQTGEKTELVSRKLIIGKIPVAADTYGGYVNVSRQNIDWTQPGVMDIIINDLAGEYSIVTEAAAGTTFTAAASAGPTIPADGATSQDIANALWTAAGSAFAATQGQGSLILAVSPDMLGLVGPLFAPVNPQNAQSAGFHAGTFGSGVMGAVSGITVAMSAGLATGTMLVLSTAAAEVYEDRIGSLQVVEPSVLGVQVAYAGYFAPLVIEPAGIIKITEAP
jgi:HK97 family phage major capsid protein